MTIIRQEAEQPTATLPIPEREQGFNWKHCWYPITFVQDLSTNRPYGFSLYDEPLVLFRNQDGQLGCLTDRCCHRAARLSDGQIIDGKLECLYHGWQYGTDGQCLHIPQLPADAKIPAKACVQSFVVVERQGIVWVWSGEPEAAEEEPIPTLADLDKPEFTSIDTVADLPYDQTYLIENSLDPAHVFISHDRTEIGVKRENAQPLEMEVSSVSVEGIRGRCRRTRLPNASWLNIEFVVPNLVLYTFANEERGVAGGLAAYSLPLGQGRCRIMLRRYSNFFSWSFKNKPRWLEHLRQNKLLEEDLPLIVGQQAHIEQLGKSLKEVYLPLKTMDPFVIEYRKWLDKFGSSLPFYQGYSTLKLAGNHGEGNQKPVLLDRFSRHTQICSSCNQAYQVTKILKQILVGMTIALAALAIVTDGSWIQILAVSASLSATALAAVAQKVKTKFERSYTRR